MKHTTLTPRNYAGFAATIFLTGTVAVGFGAIDILMISPKGVADVAAVGLGDVITSGFSALLAIGLVDTFSSRLAIEEGRGTLGRRLPVLTVATLLLIIPTQLIGSLVALGIRPGVVLAGQSPHVASLVSDFVTVRMLSIGFVIIYAGLNEALKICGLRSKTLLLLIVGFGANAVLDWLFLYSGLRSWFDSPVSAVATATTVAQVLIACCSLRFFLRALRQRGESLTRPNRSQVASEARSMARTAPGIGIRHFNDYVGTIAITLFIGVLGVSVLAAVAVATKIWSLFCRIPQACVSGTFVFYGYQIGKGDTDLSRLSRTLLWYAALPTLAGAALVASASPWIVAVFTPQRIAGLTRELLLAFLVTVPFYLLEQHFGEILSVRQRGGLLAIASSATTYLLSVPIAAVAVFVLHSPFLVIAGGVVPSAVLSWVFHRSIRQDLHRGEEVSHEQHTVLPA